MDFFWVALCFATMCVLAYIVANNNGHSGATVVTAETLLTGTTTPTGIVTVTFTPSRLNNNDTNVHGHSFEFATKPGKRRTAQIPTSFTTPQYTAHLSVPPHNTAIVELHYNRKKVGRYVRAGVYNNVPLFDTMYIDGSTPDSPAIG